MPIIQSAELQGVLQSQALCFRQKRQGLSEKEKTETQIEKISGPQIEKNENQLNLKL